MLVATTSGKHGTAAWRDNDARTVISRVRRSAAGWDQANFTTNCPAMSALDLCHCGSSSPGEGTASGYLLSSGATACNASLRAAAEHSANHLTPLS